MRKYVLISIFLLIIFHLQAQDSVIVLKDKSTLKMIGKQICFFEDETAQLTLQDIQKPAIQKKFQKHTKEVFARPASSTAVWFKIVLQNQTNEDIWLEAGGSFACWYIDFYRPDSLDSSYGKPVETGALRPEKNKEYPANFYWLKLANAQNKAVRIYYIRFVSELPQEYPLQIGTLTALHKNQQMHDALSAGFIGLMLIMVFYNLFLSFATRDKIYLAYVAYLISTTLLVCFSNNYPLSFMKSDWWWKYFLVWQGTTFLSVGFFAIRYLKLSKNSPFFYKLIWGLIVVLFIVFPIVNLLPIKIEGLLNIVQLFLMMFYLTLLSCGIYVWYKGYENARLYVLAWSSVIVTAFIMGFSLNGIIPFNLFTRNAPYFGVGLEILMFSFALADRLNVMRDEKEKAQKEALARAQENEKIIKEQNILLEQKVTKRTEELHEMNQELEVQNEEIRQHQEELMTINEALEDTYKQLKHTTDRLNSSMQYAKQIQNVILPEDSDLYKFFDDYFALYLPKDVVAGDFYWFSQLDTNRSIFVIADCTGHGVPGAFMTMVGNTLLHEIINVKNIYQPHLILSELHNEISFLLKQNKGKNSDGMDLSICLIEKQGEDTKFTFSGAKTKLYYTKNNELIELVGDRASIGGGSNIQLTKTFTSQIFYIKRGDVIYLTSDGYIDQNDKNRKRFGSQRFKKTLHEIALNPFSEQREILHQTLLTHQEKEEQRDDITVIGLKM